MMWTTTSTTASNISPISTTAASTSSYIGASIPTVTFSSGLTDVIEDKMKKYCEKVDQHVDKLEEDIDFLNNERLELKQIVNMQQTQIDLLKTQLETMNDRLNSLEGLVHWIEDHVNVEVNI